MSIPECADFLLLLLVATYYRIYNSLFITEYYSVTGNLVAYLPSAGKVHM